MSRDKTDNQSLRQRLHAVIPGGAHTYSRGDDQFPACAPALLERGEGAYVWDTDGNRYLDYGMALRSVTLGYAHPAVNAAAIAEIGKGVGLTRASMTELHAAERLNDLIPAVEMVKFAKNGSNVTTAAVKIARAHTRRRYVCVPRQHPFFSFDDWFIGATAIKRGVLAEHAETTLLFDYNDSASLEALFTAYPDQIAAVMLEPATHLTPCPGDCPVTWPRTACAACPNTSENFLQKVRALAHANGALFILDEMITGFRWHVKGAQHFFGVTPDLVTFGKAMANGFPLAAVGGKAEYMEVGAINRPGMERTFLLSSTHGGEMPSLGAFLAASRLCEEEDVPTHLWDYGAALRDGLRGLAAERGIAEHFVLEGPAVALNYVTRDAAGQPSPVMRTIFSQEMLRNGVMIPWISVSLAHGDPELDQTLTAAAAALDTYAAALDGDPARFLDGDAVKPVFRKVN
ncbi:glutamate-1-semialdehyde 2,1-aminomutase [Meridianimarinicoccus roseus]|uniref:Glutamate-1-semialdehyde 2,1-aminomutase n=1 Tax=Meridianimarinicoccus roseus TaxID=2072018 RepID=A0A2V2LGD9_9RHOB|nr:glutamate-1-semialdehyde 2,1-aminomutase [Meridianimarinicoccus roseus]PWR04545.1 glutamate-1-semialdehyde 2,1-aminomutase [Meridianimarinicoccus roseus]